MFFHYLKTALRNIRSNWVYTILSICCLAIGTVMFSALFYGVNYDDFFENRLPLRKRSAMVFLDRPDDPNYRPVPSYIMHPRVPATFVSALDIPGIEFISYYYTGDATRELIFTDSCGFMSQGHLRSKSVGGDYFRIHNLSLLYGNRIPQNENEIVVSESLLKRMGYDKDISQLSAGTFLFSLNEYQIVNVIRDDRWSRNFGPDVVFRYLDLERQKTSEIGQTGFVLDMIGLDVDVVLEKGVSIDDINKTLAQMRMTDFQGNNVVLRLDNDYNVPEDGISTMLLDLLSLIVLIVALTNFLKHTVMLLKQRSRANIIRYCMGAKQSSLSLMMTVEVLIILVCTLAAALYVSFHLCTWLNSDVFTKNRYYHFADIAIIDVSAICVVGLVCLLACRLAVYRQNKIFRHRIVVVQRERKTLKYIGIGMETTVAVFALAAVMLITCFTPKPYNPLPESERDRTFYIEYEGEDNHHPSDRSIRIINQIESLPQVEELIPTSGIWSQHNNVDCLCFEDKVYYVGNKSADVRYFSFFNIPVEWFEPTHQSQGYLMERSLYEKLLADSVDLSNLVRKRPGHYDEPGELMHISGVFEHLMGVSFSANSGMSGYIVSYNTEPSSGTFCYVKFKKGVSTSQSESLIRKAWNEVNGNTLDKLTITRIPKYVDEEDRIAALAFKTGSLVCILLVILSVSSSISAETNIRRKEVALRKINGAKARNIMELFIKPYCIILAVAFLTGNLAAMTMFTSDNLGNTRSFLMIAPVTLLVMALIITLTVFRRIRVIMRTNPADVIKSE